MKKTEAESFNKTPGHKARRHSYNQALLPPSAHTARSVLTTLMLASLYHLQRSPLAQSCSHIQTCSQDHQVGGAWGSTSLTCSEVRPLHHTPSSQVLALSPSDPVCNLTTRWLCLMTKSLLTLLLFSVTLPCVETLFSWQ